MTDEVRRVLAGRRSSAQVGPGNICRKLCEKQTASPGRWLMEERRYPGGDTLEGSRRPTCTSHAELARSGCSHQLPWAKNVQRDHELEERETRQSREGCQGPRLLTLYPQTNRGSRVKTTPRGGNYSSVDELTDKAAAVLEDQCIRGQVLNLTETEARGGGFIGGDTERQAHWSGHRKGSVRRDARHTSQLHKTNRRSRVFTYFTIQEAKVEEKTFAITTDVSRCRSTPETGQVRAGGDVYRFRRAGTI